MTQWWDAWHGNLFGAIGGSLIGVLGGTLGVMTGYLAPRGKRKSLILGAWTTLAILGALALVAGLVAVPTRQPYHVWYPLTLGGTIVALVAGLNIPGIARRYRQAEARRLDAAELRRS